MRLRNQLSKERSHEFLLPPSLQALLMRKYGALGITAGFFDRVVANGRMTLGMDDDEWTEQLEYWCHDFVEKHLLDPAFLSAQRLLQQTIRSLQSPPNKHWVTAAQASPVSVMQERTNAIKRAPPTPTIGEVSQAARENSKRELIKKEAPQSSLNSLRGKTLQSESDGINAAPAAEETDVVEKTKSKRDLTKKDKSQQSLKNRKRHKDKREPQQTLKEEKRKSKRDHMEKGKSKRSLTEKGKKSELDLLKKEKSRRSLMGQDSRSERNLIKKEKSRRSLMGQGNKGEHGPQKQEKSKRAIGEAKGGKDERDPIKKEKSQRSLMKGKRKKRKDDLLEKKESQRSLMEARRKKSKRDLMKKDKSQMSLVDGKRKKSRRSDMMKKEGSQKSLTEKKHKKSKRDLMKKEESYRSLSSHLLTSLRNEPDTRGPHSPVPYYVLGPKQPSRRDLMKKDESQHSLHSLPSKPVRKKSGENIPRPLFVDNAIEARQTSRRNLMKKAESQSSLHSLPKRPVRMASDKSDDVDRAILYIMEGKGDRTRRDLMKKEESQSSLFSRPQKPVRSKTSSSGMLEGQWNKSRRELMKKEESQSSLHSLPKMPVRRASNHEKTASCQGSTESIPQPEKTFEMPPLEPMAERIVVVRRGHISSDEMTNEDVAALCHTPVAHILEHTSYQDTKESGNIFLTETMNAVKESLMDQKQSMALGADSCDIFYNTPGPGEDESNRTEGHEYRALPPRKPSLTSRRRLKKVAGRTIGESNHTRPGPVAILATIEDNDSSASSITFESSNSVRDHLTEDMNPERWSHLSSSRIVLADSSRRRKVP